MKNTQIYLFIFVCIYGLLSCENSSSESSFLENEESINLVVKTGELNYWYNDEIFPIKYNIFEDETIEYAKSDAFFAVQEIQESQTSLVEVNGLDSSGMIYLFNNEFEFHKYVRSVPGERGCNMQRMVLSECGGGGGNSASDALYSSQNLRIYIDSYLSKEIDWTSSCYAYSNSVGNKNRMMDFNNNETDAWKFRDRNISCFPIGFSNMSDKLSSLQVSESVWLVTLYQDHNYSNNARSKKFYRRDVGLKDPEDHGGYPFWKIDFNTKWMQIGRLKNFKIGLFGISNWDNRVSSIKLN